MPQILSKGALLNSNLYSGFPAKHFTGAGMPALMVSDVFGPSEDCVHPLTLSEDQRSRVVAGENIVRDVDPNKILYSLVPSLSWAA